MNGVNGSQHIKNVRHRFVLARGRNNEQGRVGRKRRGQNANGRARMIARPPRSMRGGAIFPRISLTMRNPYMTPIPEAASFVTRLPGEKPAFTTDSFDIYQSTNVSQYLDAATFRKCSIKREEQPLSGSNQILRSEMRRRFRVGPTPQNAAQRLMQHAASAPKARGNNAIALSIHRATTFSHIRVWPTNITL